MMGWIQLVVATLDMRSGDARKNPALARAVAAGMRGKGRPPAGRREHRVRFWEAIARGVSSENAAVEAGGFSGGWVRGVLEGGGGPALTPPPGSRGGFLFFER